MLRLPAVKRWVFCVGALRVRFGEAGKRCADGQGGILGVWIGDGCWRFRIWNVGIIYGNRCALLYSRAASLSDPKFRCSEEHLETRSLSYIACGYSLGL